MHVLLIGGTRFIGRHAVGEFLDAGYEVSIFTRGNRENPFAADDRVTHVEGDRTTDGDLRRAATEDPDVVVDCVAYHPRDVRTATEVFSEVDAYVYLSSAAAYGANRIPKREAVTELHGCTPEQATDDTMASYGSRKAEGDRAVFAAADRGVNAMSVRPPIVYGPHDYTERLDYWIDRVDTHDRVLVPGDGTNLRHMAYVEDVAAALRIVAEDGTPGAAYNVGDDHTPVLGERVDLLAEACGTTVEKVYASDRELSTVGLSSDEFPLYRSYPHVLDTTRLRSLGWEATPHEEALGPTVEQHRASGGVHEDPGPSRGTEERLMGVLDTVT